MYTIHLIQGDDDLVIYNDLNPNSNFVKLINPELDMKVNTAGTLTFTMPPENIGYNIVKPITSTVEVYRDGKWLWSGRPITVSKDFWLHKKVTCEGALAFLNDIIAPLHKYSGITPTTYIGDLIRIYQNRITKGGAARIPYRMFTPSVVVTAETSSHTPIGTVDYVTEDDNILSYIKKFVDDYGLYIRLKKLQITKDGVNTGNAFRLEIINEHSLNTCEQEINFGKNLLDYSDNYEWSDIVTVLHPIGANLDTIGKTGDEDYPDHLTLASQYNPDPIIAAEIGDGITEVSDGIIEISDNSFIGSLSDDEADDEQSNSDNDEIENEQSNSDNNEADDEQSNSDNDESEETGLEPQASSPFSVEGEYLLNVSAISIYGRIEETVTWSEVEDKDTLRSLAELYLSNYQYNNMELTVKVIDLHYLSPGIKSIEFLDMVNCVSKPHNMNAPFIVTEMKIPFEKPENTAISFSRNQGGYKSDGGSSKSSKSSDISFSTSQITSRNEIMKEARDHAAAMMDMHSTGFVSFISPADSDDDRYPIGTKSRTDRIGEIWITDNIDPEMARKRWRWNINGLAHQTRNQASDDWSSPNVAITMDGAIVASYITTGVLVVPNGTGINPKTQPDIWDTSKPYVYNDPRVLFRADMTKGTCYISNFIVDKLGLHTPGKASAISRNYGTYIGAYDPVNGHPAVIGVGDDANFGLLNAGTLQLNQKIELVYPTITEVHYNEFKIDTDWNYSGTLLRNNSILYLDVNKLAVGNGDDSSSYITGLSQSVNVGGVSLNFRNGICIGVNGSGGGIEEV